jgi:hypothetical protein
MANRADNFNRADNSSALGTPSDGGSAWVALQGTWGILSNQGGLIADAGDSQDVAVLECGSSVVTVQTTITFGSCDVGLVARVVDSTNYLLFAVNSSTGCKLYKRVGGTFTQLGTTDATTPVTGDVIRMSVSAGNAITCYRNGVHLPNLDSTDAAGSTATQHGIRSSGYVAATVSFNDFSITDDGGGPPTLSAAAVPSAGTTLTAMLSQSGCIPASGTGGFTLAASGGAVAVSSWAISGTTLTLTLSRTIGAGETVTYSYDRATTTNDISDAGGTNFLANFSGASVTNNSTALAPGVVSLVSSGPGSAGIVVTATEATGGTGPYAHQWEVSDNGGAFGNATNGSGVSGATTLTLTFAATTAVVGHKYQFRLKYTDAASAVVRSGATTDLIVYTGGALTGGGSRLQGILTGGRL